MPGSITQQININVQNAPLSPPAAPNTGSGGLLSGLTDTVAGAVSSHLGLIVSIALLLALIAAGIILSRKHLRSSRSRVSFLSLFLIPIAIFAITTANSVQAVSDLVLQTNTNNLTINLTKGQGATASTTSTTTVTTTNPTGYLLTASLDQTSLNTLTNNNIALTLTGGDVTDQTFPTDQPEELLEANTATAPTGDSMDFTVTVTVPATIAVGTYAVNLTYDATDNSPATPTTMQDPNLANFCANSMSVYPDTTNGPNTLTLTDTRNNQDYTVRKLADGKCWMIDNLKLELTNGMVLTPTDTAVSTNTTVYFTQDGTAAGTALAGMTGNFTTSGSNTRNNTSTTTSPNQDAWRQNDPSAQAYCVNPTGDAYTTTNSLTGCGYLYNFYTATAGTAPQTQTTQGSTASGSICPANWHLPTGYNASGDFGQLDIAYGGTGAYQTGTPPQLSTLWLSSGAWRGLFPGAYYASFNGQSSYGYFWSSSVYSETYGYNAYLYSSFVRPGTDNNNRYSGFPVRCVLD